MRKLKPVEQQWLFTDSALHHTPSQDDGVSYVEELERRALALQYVRSLAFRAGINPKDDPSTPQAKGVFTAASTLLHRFYMRRSLADFDETLVAPAILFLASKIEEEPLKLRFIVNSCLSKFENAESAAWNPTPENDVPPSKQYRQWEKEVLIAEEIVLETLCFDMGVEQPWVVFRRCVAGVQWVGELREDVVAELGWALANETNFTPLAILHPAVVIAYTIFTLVIALVERVPLSAAEKTAAISSQAFDLDMTSDDSERPHGEDLKEVRDCMKHYLEFDEMGLMGKGIRQRLIADEHEPSPARPVPPDPTDQIPITEADPVTA